MQIDWLREASSERFVLVKTPRRIVSAWRRSAGAAFSPGGRGAVLAPVRAAEVRRVAEPRGVADLGDPQLRRLEEGPRELQPTSLQAGLEGVAGRAAELLAEP